MKAPSTSSLRFLWKLIRPNIRSLVPGIVLSVVATFLSLLQPLLTGQVLESLGSMTDLMRTVAMLVGVLFGAVVLTYLSSLLTLRGTENAVAVSRISVVRAALGLGPAEMRLRNPGVVMSHVTSDSAMLRTIASQFAVQILTSTITVTGSLLIMLSLNPFLLTVTVCGVILPAGALLLTMPKVTEWSRRTQESMADLNKEMERSFGNFSMVKAHTAEDQEDARLTESIEVVADRSRRSAQWRSLNTSLALLTMNCSYLLVLVGGGMEVLNDRLTVPQLITFLMYAAQMAAPIISLATAIAAFSSAAASLERLAETGGWRQERTGGQPAPAEFSGPVARLTGVEYSPPKSERTIFDGLDVDIPRTGFTAVVGASGSGKSTLLNLLVGFVEPDQGEIDVEGMPVTSWDLHELRHRVALVEQEAGLMEGTVRENLLYGWSNPEDVADESLIEVLDAVGLKDQHVEPSDDVGYRGSALSGGQRQRLAIARGLLRGPSLLLLDESTAALDSEAERSICMMLRKLGTRISVVMVAHRPSAFTLADRSIVLENGRVSAFAPHDELMETSDLYRTLVSDSHDSVAGR